MQQITIYFRPEAVYDLYQEKQSNHKSVKIWKILDSITLKWFKTFDSL